jgi:hypothetical protein
MSKSKQKKFSKVQAVKEKSRRVLGSPKPTSVRSSRPRSSSGSAALDPILNQKDVSANPHYHPHEKPVEGAPRLSTVSGLHIHAPAGVRPPRTKAEPASAGLQYSKEVIQHLNILRAQKGEQAVSEYLNSLKEKNPTMTSSLDLAERLTREHDSPVPVNGSIETALHDAEMKVGFYQGEVQRCTAESQRWLKIVENLKQVLELTSGPVEASKGNRMRPDNVKPKGFWAEQFRKVLTDRKPLPRLELFAKMKPMLSKEEISRMYPAMYAGLKSGLLIELDGKIGLTEWTEPSK